MGSIAQTTGMMKARMVIALLAAAQALGCSYMVVRPPPAEEGPVPYYACRVGVAPPVVDTVLAVSDAVAAPYYAMTSYNKSQYASFALAGTLVGVAVFGSSAVYGYYQIARCRDAQAQYGTELSPPMGTPPPPGWAPPPPVFGACERDIDCPTGTVCAKGACLPQSP